eukprot:TRINITY_DN74561_c0_g1_i1.p1 TRINITY_DN74561_c0_g1~~TRINITY_DN74561_c0_g1_i1.p1  ORF type:complete len:501 (-),score=75.18 TRINITY_DN74561_c0_g1_i1:81-1583(-)
MKTDKDFLRQATARISREGKQGHWREAVATLQQLVAGSCRLDVVVVNAVLAACDRSRVSWAWVLRKLAELPTQGFSASVSTLNTVISSCGHGRAWHVVQQLLHEEMAKLELPADILSINAAATACERVGRWSFAVHLLLRAAAKSQQRVDVITFAAALSACEKGAAVAQGDRCWEMAAEILTMQELHGLQGNLVACNAAVSACSAVYGSAKANSGESSDSAGSQLRNSCAKWEEAMLLKTRAGLACLKQDVVTTNAAISGCMRGHQWLRGLAILDTIEHTSIQPDVIGYSAAFSECELPSHWITGQCLLNSLLACSGEVDLVACGALLGACQDGSAWERCADRLLLFMANGVPANILCWSAASSAAESAGRWTFALQVQQASCSGSWSRRRELTVVSCTAQIRACQLGAQWRQAAQVLLAMEEGTLSANELSYEAAARACEGEGRFQTLLSLLYDVRKRVIPARRSGRCAPRARFRAPITGTQTTANPAILLPAPLRRRR